MAAGVVQADHFARIERLAFQDPLTGLANRRAVDERLEASMADYTENGTPVSLVLADINKLKQVNDSFGHEAGDRLIVAVAEAVSRASGLAHGSLAARIGGDEFCIVTTGVPADQAVEVAEELCRIVDNQPLSTGVSCGVASTDSPPGPFQTPLRLFRLADAAQYRAKRSGSRKPVVAGSTAADVPEESHVDRRARRGRLAVDGLAVLEAGYRGSRSAARLLRADAARGDGRPRPAAAGRRCLVGLTRTGRRRHARQREQLRAAVRREPRRQRHRPVRDRGAVPPRRLPGQPRRDT